MAVTEIQELVVARIVADASVAYNGLSQVPSDAWRTIASGSCRQYGGLRSREVMLAFGPGTYAEVTDRLHQSILAYIEAHWD